MESNKKFTITAIIVVLLVIILGVFAYTRDGFKHEGLDSPKEQEKILIEKTKEEILEALSASSVEKIEITKEEKKEILERLSAPVIFLDAKDASEIEEIKKGILDALSAPVSE